MLSYGFVTVYRDNRLDLSLQNDEVALYTDYYFQRKPKNSFTLLDWVAYIQ